MSNEAANVKILQDAYHRWSESKGGSVDHWFDVVVAPKINFASIPRGVEPLAFATEYHDSVKLRAYFDTLLSEWSMQHYTMNEYVAQGDAVVARGSCAWINKRTGKLAETPKLDFWRFKDGKAIEFYEYFDTACVVAAAT
ncbi:nuclear transport factor 2 family protein [Bradyrhizobium diazoefficiens]|uniref:nuclear transport factor 2 family protein n=1 Tax=Bradyrhizobium diazoefficiens TaxID=1355477 RepID=UPI001B8AA12B|nr:nuclear transport factor 2 family protein [Bradyrhizobium diazoefficiens]MBR0861572.1 nuclear transport factor 2 family protein [Bradyrhizobium diazoefficiens]MBR0886057.1 nuclear transport factor 2 family protein [Bradyrhizobium diazoefficiens]MBR0917880.1 nuclear transport factor 2 family protein [Bradyrhizobium diazoefficiens]